MQILSNVLNSAPHTRACRANATVTPQVHCKVGSSRSAAAVLAFLVHLGFSLQDAAQTVRSKREVCPNTTFLALLVQYERAVVRTRGDSKGDGVKAPGSTVTPIP